MTEKQEKILEAALKLFAREGYASVSTSKVARTAGVSEGLIFRHFGSKEGLLNALLEESQAAARAVMAEVLMTSEPKDIIRKILAVPFHVNESDYEMWRLTYALKWQTDRYRDDYQEPVKLVLEKAFEKLGYEDPAAEVELIYMFLDGAATALLLHRPERTEAILKALEAKYHL